MYPSDYGYAARSSCNKDLHQYHEDENCSTSGNWLYIQNKTQWLMTPRSDITSSAFRVYNTGYIYDDILTHAYTTRPVVYLKSSIHLTGGNGTPTSPYVIE